jgi:NADH dehydrogenase
MSIPTTGKVLVTGGAGVMGTRLVRGLIDRGLGVRALILPQDPGRSRLAEWGCEIHEGNVADAASLAGCCDGIDTVYHLAAVIISPDEAVFRTVNLEGTANMVAAARSAGVGHFVYVSSASVTYPRRTPYAESKLRAERLVAGEPAFEHTIVRPTLAFDETGGQEFVMFLSYLRRWPIVPMIGTGSAKKRPVYAGDIVDGLLRLANQPVSYGKIYNLSGAESISMIDFARLALEHHNSRKRFVPVPVALCRTIAFIWKLISRRPGLTSNAILGVVQDADLDPAEAIRDLGYQPMGVREGFRRCLPFHASLQRGADSSIRVSPTESQAS